MKPQLVTLGTSNDNQKFEMELLLFSLFLLALAAKHTRYHVH